ncbi:MAG: serine/threonine-protein kinase [Cyanobacteria bacterium J06598_1]
MAERYQIIRRLAQGGFGKTYLAGDRHLPGQPHCVIKQFFPVDATAETVKIAQRLFSLEAETLYQLGTHDQIPTLLAHFEQAGEFYLVQDYIAGQDLTTELKQISATTDRAQYTYSLLMGLLSTLAFVHQNNVIHRDIKPDNILRRSSDEKLVLIDFGAVKTFQRGAAENTVAIGSPGYMAPEQQAGRPCFASDLYAVGVIGLQALTGKSLQQQPADPQTGELQIATEIAHSELAEFIAKLIQSAPGDRYPNATLAAAALKELSTLSTNGSLPKTPPPSPTANDAHIAQTVLPPNITAPHPERTASRQSSSTEYAETPTAVRNRQALLNKVHRFWIQGVLQHSLHGQVLLTLGLEERNQALALPWNISWESESQPIQALAAGTSLFSRFQHLGEGRSLLILGEPGAGKTTTLLTLTRDLLDQWQPGQRIPAVFNLSSWTGESLDQWLISELNSKYQIPKSIGHSWVQEQQLLLLLDGLDEVRLDRRSRCAAVINQFYQDYGPELVVCCRMNDYEALEEQLTFQSAVYVRSLTDQQIWQYLDQAETGLTGLRSLLEQSLEQSAAKPKAHTGQALFELARSPLILNIMALTYQGISAREIPTLSQSESYTHQLFSAYVERMFQRRGFAGAYTKQQTLRWLRSLAIMLTQTSQTVFLIERMQVNWLTSKPQRAAYVALVVSAFLMIATAVGWHVVRRQALPLALIVGGAICAKIFGLYRIVPAEKLCWSWREAARSLLLGITLGPLIGWLLKVTFVYAFSASYCLSTPGCFQSISSIGLSFGTILGLTYGVIRGFSGSQIAIVTKPNQGIRQSAKNAIFFSVIATVAPWFIAHSFDGSTSPLFWAAAGLTFALATGGGEACVKHGALRLVLFCQGRIPWNYARFLNDAADRIFLQRVGGGYIFVHRLLLEHFANMPAPHKRLH